MPELHERVQALPPEIFDRIKDLIFTFNSTKVTVDEHYKPPTQLRISKGTRLLFADAYYGSTVFEFKQPSIFYKWLDNLSKAHLNMIRVMELQVHVPRKEGMPGGPLGQTEREQVQTSDTWEWCSYWVSEIIKSKISRSTNAKDVARTKLVVVDSEHAADMYEWSDGRICCRGWNDEYLSISYQL